MDLGVSAMVGIVISGALSAILCAMILPPIRKVLRNACPSEEAVQFWIRFVVLMLVLGPLILTLVFGLPIDATPVKSDATSSLLRIVTTALIGQFLALSGIGIRIATLRIERQISPSPERRSDDSWVK